MNRKVWESKEFEGKSFSKFTCPRCFVGNLIPIEKISKITKSGQDLQQHGYPYGIENYFSGFLECNNSNCTDIVSVNGILRTDIQHGYQLPDGEWIEVNFNYYVPKFFVPNLRMFDLNDKNIPKSIRRQIDSSFSLYFNDEAACANKIRTSIELILDDLKAPKRTKNKSNKLVILRTLHDRIENYKKSKPQLCKLLLALKIVGNEGSHTAKVQNEDLLNAYEILEEVIDTLYIKKRHRILRIANNIISK